MSKLTESLAKEYLEREKAAKPLNTRWEQYAKLSNKLGEILNDLRVYDFRKLTEEENSKKIELEFCRRALDDKMKESFTNEQQYSEIMEKLHTVVQETLDFLKELEVKYGSLEDVKARNAVKEFLISFGLVIGFFAFTGIITWLACR